jgi:hypothetical protein
MIEGMENQTLHEQAPKPIFATVNNMESKARASFAQKLAGAGLSLIADKIANGQDSEPVRESISYLLKTGGVLVGEMKNRLIEFFKAPKGELVQ